MTAPYARLLLRSMYKMLTSPIALLPEMRTDEGDQLQLDMYLPRAQGSAEGGSRYPVRQLWLQRMRVFRLNNAWFAVLHIYSGTDGQSTSDDEGIRTTGWACISIWDRLGGISFDNICDGGLRGQDVLRTESPRTGRAISWRSPYLCLPFRTEY